jgi:flagellin FlaB
MKQDNAFTGLEAAIVLIAFIVVAAVFSYVLLGAGFFATQKAQEVTYAGIQQVTSNMFLVGQVYGDTEPASDGSGKRYLNTINFLLGVPEGGQPQSAEELQLLFSNDIGLPIELTYAGIGTTPGADEWSITRVNQEIATANTDPRLYPGDKAAIQIGLDAEEHKITSKRGDSDDSRTFTLEIKPRIGASYLIAKTLSTGYTHGPLY